MSSPPVECLITGMPGAGKTLFALSLAGCLAHTGLQVYSEEPDGRVVSRSWTVDQARQAPVPPDPGRYGLQWMTLSIPMGIGRGKRDVLLIDSAGLPPGISPDPGLRDGAARTLDLLRRARILVHLVDASAEQAPGDLDRAVVAYASAHLQGRFVVLASKMDLPRSPQGLRRMRRAWPRATVLPLSSINRRSLLAVTRELRQCVEACSAEAGAGDAR
jgi:hypothetical protein